MKLYIWTDRFSYLAIAHTDNVAAARKLMLETSDLGESGDGSCPERDRARKTILEETPAIYYGEIAEFSLSDSASLRECEAHNERLLKDLALRARRIAELEFQIAAHPAAIAAAKRETAARCAAIASEVSASYDKEDGFPSHHAVGAETVAVTIIAKFGLVRKVKP